MAKGVRATRQGPTAARDAECPPTCPRLSGGVCSISCAAPLSCPAEPAMMARALAMMEGEPDTRRMWGWKA